jgi:hypothetical protein
MLRFLLVLLVTVRRGSGAPWPEPTPSSGLASADPVQASTTPTVRLPKAELVRRDITVNPSVCGWVDGNPTGLNILLTLLLVGTELIAYRPMDCRLRNLFLLERPYGCERRYDVPRLWSDINFHLRDRLLGNCTFLVCRSDCHLSKQKSSFRWKS